MKSLNELRDEALRIATEHGFTDATVGEDLMLMVTELAEAMEDHRGGKGANTFWYTNATGVQDGFLGPNDAPNKLCGIPSEIADVVIRCLHFAGKHKIDIERAVLEKMAYNNSRPFKHGKTL